MDYVKLFIASLTTIFLILGIWITSYHYNCLMMVFPLLVLLLISYSFIELKVQERTCFKECFFNSTSLFARMLTSKFFVILFYLFMSVLMTASALYGVLDYSREFWLYLLVHIAFMTVLYRYLSLKLSSTLKTGYQRLFARELAINITTPFIVGAFVYFTLNGFEPSYLKSSLEETWRSASATVSSDCVVVNYLLKLQKEIDSIFWWIMDSGTQNIKDSTHKIGIWISFLLINSLAILGINRFIAQVIYLVDKIFNRRKR